MSHYLLFQLQLYSSFDYESLVLDHVNNQNEDCLYPISAQNESEISDLKVPQMISTPGALSQET